MLETLCSWTRKSRRWILPSLVLGIGFVAGSAFQQVNVVEADVRRSSSRPAPRRSPERATFQSGSARSDTILREIATTLKRIDGRIERIERSISAKQQKQGT